MPASRRAFLGRAAAVAGAAAMSSCSSLAPVARRRRPDRLRLMVIGVAGRGRANLHGVKGEEVRVLCDVDSGRLAAAAKEFPGAETLSDYRAVLGDAERCAELDGVVISTPDHSHYPPAMLAMRQGLDVYCEKPLTHTVAQARRLREAAERYGCVTQMGIQIHARENFRRVVEAIRAGAVGPVREVYVFVNGTNWSAEALPEYADVPSGLDYDLWLGPAAEQPYRSGFHPAGWRRYWAFGGGTTGDMACHYTDVAFWALDLDAPSALQADGSPPHSGCAPAALRCRYEFAARGERAPIVLHWHGGRDRPSGTLAERGLEKWTNGVLFVGDDGWLITDYDRHEIGPRARAESWERPPHSIASSPGHHREWIECCKARIQPSCSFSYGGPLTEHVLLANIAFRAAKGRRLAWDTAALRFGDERADRLLDEPAREGFSV